MSLIQLQVSHRLYVGAGFSMHEYTNLQIQIWDISKNHSPKGSPLLRGVCFRLKVENHTLSSVLFHLNLHRTSGWRMP